MYTRALIDVCIKLTAIHQKWAARDKKWAALDQNWAETDQGTYADTGPGYSHVERARSVGNRCRTSSGTCAETQDESKRGLSRPSGETRRIPLRSPDRSKSDAASPSLWEKACWSHLALLPDQGESHLRLSWRIKERGIPHLVIRPTCPTSPFMRQSAIPTA